LYLRSLPIYDRRANRQVAGSGGQAGPESLPESGPKSAPAIRRAAAAIKLGGVRTASTEAATSVESTAAEAAVHAPTEATATAARRHNVGCKHSKRRSRQQRDRSFTEHG
jgi:hypothetical protein